LVCFGRSDVARRYHPISYMLTSREEEKDFFVFYDELLRLANSCNIFFRPYYVMQDAAPASAVALRRVFPYTYVLMCWFHMKKCIQDNLHRLNPKHHNTVVKDVDRLHFSLNPADFEEKRKQIMNKWIGEEWLAWNAYFWPQWMNGWFVYWQIWNTPPGGSSGNNPIESFNKQIKDCFTKYESLSVINLLNVICRDIIVYYSYNQHPISMVANVPSDDCKKDHLILLEMKLCDAQFQIYSYLPNTILFTDSTSKPPRIFHQFIDMAKRSCTCSFYIDRAICHHLIFSSRLFKFTIGKQSIPSKTFVKMKSSGRKKKNSKALQK
jgi:hypothetical protein